LSIEKIENREKKKDRETEDRRREFEKDKKHIIVRINRIIICGNLRDLREIKIELQKENRNKI